MALLEQYHLTLRATSDLAVPQKWNMFQKFWNEIVGG